MLVPDMMDRILTAMRGEDLRIVLYSNSSAARMLPSQDWYRIRPSAHP